MKEAFIVEAQERLRARLAKLGDDYSGHVSLHFDGLGCSGLEFFERQRFKKNGNGVDKSKPNSVKKRKIITT